LRKEGKSMKPASAVVLLVLSAAAPAPAGAGAPAPRDYPARSIRLIVPGAPGVPPDLAARIVGERLASALGKPIVIENRPGATGTIALAELAKAPADGYTIGTLGLPYTVAPSLYPKLAYDTARDFAPVGQVLWSSQLLVVDSGSSWRSLQELVTAAGGNPGKLAFSSGQVGVPSYLVGEMLKLRTRADIRAIPFKGAMEGLAAVMGGQTDFMFAPAGSAAALVKSGKLRPLATATPGRLAAYPDVPTMAELGYPGFDVRDWNGIVAPAGTPPGIVARLAVEVRNAVAAPVVRERLAAISMEPALDSSPEQFGALIRAELARWAKFVRDTGLRAD
jgi:tripartite-type tricarboxylate transporter receptor subunit TctC